jgi:hypothetical protein
MVLEGARACHRCRRDELADVEETKLGVLCTIDYQYKGFCPLPLYAPYKYDGIMKL